MFAYTASHHQKHLACSHVNVAHHPCQTVFIRITCSHGKIVPHLLYIPAWGPQLCHYFFWVPTIGVPYRQYRPLLPAPSNRRLVRGFNDSVSVGVLPLSLFPNGHVYFTQKLHEVRLPPVHFFQLLHCQLMLFSQP